MSGVLKSVREGEVAYVCANLFFFRLQRHFDTSKPLYKHTASPFLPLIHPVVSWLPTSHFSTSHFDQHSSLDLEAGVLGTVECRRISPKARVVMDIAIQPMARFRPNGYNVVKCVEQLSEPVL